MENKRQHIVSLHAENVKRLVAVDITPAGNLVVIGGMNTAGKSSVLDSIAYVLGGGAELPPMPVRRGAEKAQIIADLGDIIVKRTFTAKGGTALVIENREGLRYQTPQSILDKLTGKLTFDPLAFTKMDAKKQAETLRKLVGVDFTDLDAERKRLYDERTLVNKDVARAKAKVDFMEHFPEAPAEEVIVTEIVKERDAAKEHNAKKEHLEAAVRQASAVIASSNNHRAAIVGEIERLEAQLKELRARLEAAHSEMPANQEQLKEAQEALLGFNPIDIAPINERLASAETVNEQVRANKAREAAAKEVDTVQESSRALTAKIEEIDAKKAETLASVKYPVEGLSFSDDGVTYNGVPFEQASGAEQLRISVAIAAALNPKLGVMLVRDGSLMDKKSMALLAGLAGEHDLQVWIEMVSSDEPGTVIIEDGVVAGADKPDVMASE